MSNMKKILFVSNVLSHIRAFHLPYINYLRSKGYIVHILTNANGADAPYCDKLYDLEIARSPYKLRNIMIINQAKRIITNEKYDLIHCHTPMGGVIGRIASKKARKTGTKVIYTAHGFHFYKGAPLKNWLLFYPVERHLAKLSDCIITINHEDYNIAVKKFSALTKYIYKIDGIGVDINRFGNFSTSDKEIIKKKFGYQNKFVLTYAAEFIPRKNHFYLLRALSILAKDCPNVLISFAGDGILLDAAKKEADKLGVADYVDFRGYCTNMPELFAASDVVISSSIEEGFGINIVEGMSSGLPAVASLVRGHMEMVQNNYNGFLFNTNSLDSFCDAVKKLYGDKNTYHTMSVNAKQTSLKFSIEHSLFQMKDIYCFFLK